MCTLYVSFLIAWVYIFCLFVIFRHTQQFFSYNVYDGASVFIGGRENPDTFIQCIWEETTDLLQKNWQTFSHSHIGTRRTQTDTGWYEIDVLTTRPRRPHAWVYRHSVPFAFLMRQLNGVGPLNETDAPFAAGVTW
jgi:hypothetical protein